MFCSAFSNGYIYNSRKDRSGTLNSAVADCVQLDYSPSAGPRLVSGHCQAPDRLGDNPYRNYVCMTDGKRSTAR